MSFLPLALATALSFTAPNGLTVMQTGAETFSVPYQSQSGPAAFWCAAGAHVVHDLGKAPSTRIWRASALPRRSGQGMDFALTPVAGAKTGLVLLGSDDGSLSALHALTLCYGLR